MSDKKKFGLLMPKKADASKIKKHSVFSDDESEEDQKSNRRPKIPQKKINSKSKVKPEQVEDPSIYEYDNIYDEMKLKQAESIAPKEKQNSRYIETLMKAAEKRKKEYERRVDEKIQIEREKEGDKFKDLEAFVTSSYKKKMLEKEEEEERERRKDMLNDMMDVTKQNDISGFYRHFLKQTVGEEKVPEFEDRKIKKEIVSQDDSSQNSEEKAKSFKNIDQDSDGVEIDSDNDENIANEKYASDDKKRKQYTHSQSSHRFERSSKDYKNLDADSDGVEIDSDEDKSKGNETHKKDDKRKKSYNIHSKSSHSLSKSSIDYKNLDADSDGVEIDSDEDKSEGNETHKRDDQRKKSYTHSKSSHSPSKSSKDYKNIDEDSDGVEIDSDEDEKRETAYKGKKSRSKSSSKIDDKYGDSSDAQSKKSKEKKHVSGHKVISLASQDTRTQHRKSSQSSNSDSVSSDDEQGGSVRIKKDEIISKKSDKNNNKNLRYNTDSSSSEGDDSDKIVNKNTTEGDKTKKKSPDKKSPEKNIYGKRTVGDIFADAQARYFKRMALRDSGI